MKATPTHAHLAISKRGKPYLYVTYELEDGRVTHKITSHPAILLAMLGPIDVDVMVDERRPERLYIELAHHKRDERWVDETGSSSQ